MNKRKLLLANNPLLSGPSYEERGRSTIPYRQIPIDLVDRDANQPRINFDEEKLHELAQSIGTYGILSPLLVKPSKTVPGRYVLIAGERRFRAAKSLGLEEVPVLVESSVDESGERTLAMQLVENLQRADLTPLERAHAIGALKETHNLSVRDVAEKLGISKSMVQRSLDILDLPDDLLNALREGAAESKILLIAKIEDPDVRSSYLKDLEVLTRKQIQKDLEKRLVDHNGVGVQPTDPEDQRIIDELQRSLGLKVRITRNSTNPEAGRILLDFYSSEDFREVFRKLIAE